MTVQLDTQSEHRIRQFAASGVFDRLFEEGMGLVEETATYLDGEGREQSRELSREASLSYATVSMETTTRLMQAASWLVVQRAVREEDMSPEDANDEKFRLEYPSTDRTSNIDLNLLPDHLVNLVHRSRKLFERICRLDEQIYRGVTEVEAPAIRNHFDALQQAADSGAFDPLSVWRRS